VGAVIAAAARVLASRPSTGSRLCDSRGGSASLRPYVGCPSCDSDPAAGTAITRMWKPGLAGRNLSLTQVVYVPLTGWTPGGLRWKSVGQRLVSNVAVAESLPMLGGCDTKSGTGTGDRRFWACSRGWFWGWIPSFAVPGGSQRR